MSRLAAALGHPDRLRILMEMNTPIRRMSPKQYAECSGLPPRERLLPLPNSSAGRQLENRRGTAGKGSDRALPRASSARSGLAAGMGRPAISLRGYVELMEVTAEVGERLEQNPAAENSSGGLLWCLLASSGWPSLGLLNAWDGCLGC